MLAPGPITVPMFAESQLAIVTTAGSASLLSPVRRSARIPSVLVRRLAALYEQRSLQFSGLDACVRGP